MSFPKGVPCSEVVKAIINKDACGVLLPLIVPIIHLHLELQSCGTRTIVLRGTRTLLFRNKEICSRGNKAIPPGNRDFALALALCAPDLQDMAKTLVGGRPPASPS